MPMKLPLNDIELLRYNAEYRTHQGGLTVGETNVIALAQDLDTLLRRVTKTYQEVRAIRATNRRAFSRQTMLLEDKMTLIRDALDMNRAGVVSDVDAILTNKFSHLTEYLDEGRQTLTELLEAKLKETMDALQTGVSADTASQMLNAFQEPSMTSRTPFNDLRSSILGTTPIFKVSMPHAMREKYSAYLSMLKKPNGIDCYYLDASRMPRHDFLSARQYMPQVIRSNPLWYHV